MIHELRPATPEARLEHYGKKGMKWGKTTAEASGGSGLGKPKKPSNDQIKAARERQKVLGRKYQNAEGEFMVARTRKGTDAAEKTMRSLEKEYYLGKDAHTAARLTKGEKIATGIAYGLTGAVAIAILAGGH